MTEAKCEPPPELRGVDGWHWVVFKDGQTFIAQWANSGLWIEVNMPASARNAAKVGFRYDSPVLTPAEAAALRAERDAAKRAEANMAALCQSAEDDNAALRADNARLREALKYLRAYPHAIAAQTNADDVLARAALAQESPSGG